MKNYRLLHLKFEGKMDLNHVTRKYSNGEVEILWQSHLCSHSGVCFRGLPQVFDPRKKPWVNPENASTEEIVTQVKKCPSGALINV